MKYLSSGGSLCPALAAHKVIATGVCPPRARTVPWRRVAFGTLNYVNGAS